MDSKTYIEFLHQKKNNHILFIMINVTSPLYFRLSNHAQKFYTGCFNQEDPVSNRNTLNWTSMEYNI